MSRGSANRASDSESWTRTRLGAVLVAALMMMFACSNDSTSRWCTDSAQLLDSVHSYREFSELPSGGTLRRQLRQAIDVAPAVVDGASTESRGAFLTLAAGVGDLDRTLGSYDYDLLRAQSESDSAEQDDLYALDGAVITNALVLVDAEFGRRCQGP